MVCNYCGRQFNPLMEVNHVLRLEGRDENTKEGWNLVYKPSICPRCTSLLVENLQDFMGRMSHENRKGD